MTSQSSAASEQSIDLAARAQETSETGVCVPAPEAAEP